MRRNKHWDDVPELVQELYERKGGTIPRKCDEIPFHYWDPWEGWEAGVTLFIFFLIAIAIFIVATKVLVVVLAPSPGHPVHVFKPTALIGVGVLLLIGCDRYCCRWFLTRCQEKAFHQLAEFEKYLKEFKEHIGLSTKSAPPDKWSHWMGKYGARASIDQLFNEFNHAYWFSSDKQRMLTSGDLHEYANQYLANLLVSVIQIEDAPGYPKYGLAEKQREARQPFDEAFAWLKDYGMLGERDKRSKFYELAAARLHATIEYQI